MKKIIALILAATCIFAVAGCQNSGDSGQNNQQTASYENATEVLTTVWDDFGSDEQFAVWGGNAEAMTDGAPGTFDLTKTDELCASIVLTADQVSAIDDAATLLHGMNTNSFTAAALHTTEDAAAFADTYAQSLGANHWMCGMPETYVVIDAGSGYLVTAFGTADNISAFETHALGTLSGSTVIKSGAIGE